MRIKYLKINKKEEGDNNGNDVQIVFDDEIL